MRTKAPPCVGVSVSDSATDIIPSKVTVWRQVLAPCARMLRGGLDFKGKPIPNTMLNKGCQLGLEGMIQYDGSGLDFAGAHKRRMGCGVL